MAQPEVAEHELSDLDHAEHHDDASGASGSTSNIDVQLDKSDKSADTEKPDDKDLLEDEEPRFFNCAFTRTKAWKIFMKIMKRYFIDALTGMSQGLFVTLIAGTIIKQVGKLIGATTKGGNMFMVIGNLASALTGPGIGCGIAKSLSTNNLVIFATMVAGLLGAFSDQYIKNDGSGTGWGNNPLALAPGNPIGSYIASVICCELGNTVVRLKTRLDILLVPLVMFIGSIGAAYVCWPFRTAGTYIAVGIEKASDAQPVLMSIVMSCWVGLLLTLPTSSAATCISLQIGGIAGGAAVTGCCCHMVGFAVASFRENGWQGLISQGIGTSMIQIPNIVKHPLILVPQVISSIIMGPIATCALGIKCVPAASGMGTAGLVGLFGTIEGTGDSIPKWQLGLGIALTQFILPAAISLGISEFMRWRKWILPGDQKLAV